MKQKILLTICAVLMSAASVFAQTVDSGNVGECQWTVTGTSGNYTLTISGTGSMVYPGNAPWISHIPNIKTLTVGAGITAIGSGAFRNHTALTTVNYNATNCTSYPNSLNNPFDGCTTLATVVIGNNVTNLPSSAFYGCSKLTSVTIGTGISTISSYAFNGCTALTLITIPDNITSISSSAFYNSGLTSVNLNNVTSISNDAFNYSKLTSVNLSSVTSIGSSAFCNTKLASLTIPATVTSIGNGAFQNCTALTTVNYNATNCTSYPNLLNNPFDGCTTLATVVIGNNVINLPSYAFSYLTALSSVTAPWATPLSINSNVFSGCGDLKAIQLIVPLGSENTYNGAPVWQDFCIKGLCSEKTGNCGMGGSNCLTWNYNVGTKTLTFSGNCNMENYTSSNTPWYNFRHKIKTVVTHEGITSIGTYAFSDCINLFEFINYRPAPPLTIVPNVFNNVNQSKATLYVPAGSVEAYSTYAVWNLFGNFLPIILSAPTVTTTSASGVTTTGATLGGNVTNVGTPAYTERGVVYATTQNPTTSSIKVPVSGTGTGAYSTNVTGLNSGTTYYVRAYAINSVGTAYGAQVSFTTLNLPTVTTTAASNITATGATLGGNVTNVGNPTYTERGVVYATTPNPTTSNTKVLVSGTGTGEYSTNVTTLNSGTTYYVRAYAINSAGTVYGSQVSFTTLNLPTVTTTAATGITISDATLGGNVTNVGNPAYTERGVVYATTQNPTTSDTKVAVSGTGTGSYTTPITGLIANTTYYVRAYAINSVGTVYGSQVSFTTLNTYTVTLPTITGATIAPQSGSSSPVNYGDNYSFTVILEDCYNLSDIVVKSNGTILNPVSGVYTISNITEDQVITVEGLQINTYEITATVNNPDYGTISPEGTKTVDCGSLETYIITPNDNYKISDVLVNGESQGVITTYTFENIQVNGTIHVIFIEDVGIKNLYLQNLSLFPNPTTGQLTIDNGQLTIINVEIFDVFGRKVLEPPLTVLRSYDLTVLHPGVYFVKITTEAGQVVKKVVKE